MKIFRKVLKKGKNNVFYIYLAHIGKTHSKRVIFIGDNINQDLNKISFYELYISLKIIQDSSKKFISKVIIKLSRIHTDF